jgi:hypothetical protein
MERLLDWIGVKPGVGAMIAAALEMVVLAIIARSRVFPWLQ